MTHRLTIDGQRFTLTTEHVAISHGVPVLIDGHGRALGPTEASKLGVDAASDECCKELTRAGYTWTDCRG